MGKHLRPCPTRNCCGGLATMTGAYCPACGSPVPMVPPRPDKERWLLIVGVVILTGLLLMVMGYWSGDEQRPATPAAVTITPVVTNDVQTSTTHLEWSYPAKPVVTVTRDSKPDSIVTH